MTAFTPWESGSESLVVAIVEALEEHGLESHEYQLTDFVEPDALQRLMTSNAPVTVEFSVHGIKVTVTRDGVTASKGAEEG